MARGAPVVASAVGGVPEIVDDGVTGILVPFEPVSASDGDPADPEQFAADLADAINELVANPGRADAMREAGLRRVADNFSWSAMAQRTIEPYRGLVDGAGRRPTI